MFFFAETSLSFVVKPHGFFFVLTMAGDNPNRGPPNPPNDDPNGVTHLVAHPTARKWVITPVINGMFVGLIHL